MKYPALLPFLSLVAACSSHDNIAGNGVDPPASVRSADTDNWSTLSGMIGRTPAESGLLQNSSVSVDLQALLGPDAARYRDVAEAGSPLTRAGPVLVTVGRDRRSFLLSQPADHALQAGLRQANGWQIWTTPAAQIPRPAAVQALLAS